MFAYRLSLLPKRFLHLLGSDESEGEKFRAFFTKLFQDVPLEAYFWECNPVDLDDIAEGSTKPFEFTIIPYARFEDANPQVFHEIFSNVANAGLISTSFMNLMDNSVIVCPIPRSTQQKFGHLAQFVRTVSEWEVVHSIWKTVSRDMTRLLKEHTVERVWLSTYGPGMPWFHIRLDVMPIYYHTASYKT